MRSVENAECGKRGVWKMRSVENEECGKFSLYFKYKIFYKSIHMKYTQLFLKSKHRRLQYCDFSPEES